MRFLVAMMLAFSLLAIGCTAELKPEDKTLLQNALKAADEAKEAKVACEKASADAKMSAEKAGSAADRAMKAAEMAEESAKKAERAAAKCEKSFTHSLRKH